MKHDKESMIDEKQGGMTIVALNKDLKAESSEMNKGVSSNNRPGSGKRTLTPKRGTQKHIKQTVWRGGLMHDYRNHCQDCWRHNDNEMHDQSTGRQKCE